LKLAALSLGSNLGDRLHHLQMARDRLRTLAASSHPFLQSPVYQTSPIHCPPDSPDFLNTAIAFHFAGTALELLAATQAIEADLGRPAERAPNSPRPIDIDILIFGDDPISSADLTIPHPRLHQRRFVLQPLADILPDLVLPGDSRTIADILAQLPSDDPPLAQFASEW